MITRLIFLAGTRLQGFEDKQEGRKRPEVIALETGGPGSPRLVDSRMLFGGEHEIGIVHGGKTYRLRITRQGKLILTK